jgi:3-methyl-2-oxobutanoate hydroxymethyltransferase
MKENRQSHLQYPKDWTRRKKEGHKISVLTAYDYTFARLAALTDVDALLVGDSLGMTIQGLSSTLPVSLDEMIYHAKMVKRGAPSAFIIIDMPFGSFQSGINDAVKNAVRIMKETECSAVKLEGYESDTLQIIERLTKAGVPVMGHAGLTPQSFMSLGGFVLQGRDKETWNSIKENLVSLQNAGCFSVVLELMQPDLSAEISSVLEIPTIGIGSGSGTDGQVQVMHDILGLNPDFTPKHAKKYMNLADAVRDTFRSYDEEVKNGEFPGTDQIVR